MLTAVILWISSFNPYIITIKGNCYDVFTNTVLKSNVSAVFKTSRHSIHTAENSGNFTFIIPDSTLYLTFEAKGFETRTIPINMVKKPEKGATFDITVPMLQIGSNQAIKTDETLFPHNMLFLHYDVPDSLIMHILFKDESVGKVSGTRPIVNEMHRPTQ